MTQITRFVEFTSANFYEDTDLRPSAEQLQQLEEEFQREKSFRHKPGDGYHYLSLSAIAYLYRAKWSLQLKTSHGSVLAHVEDLCKELGLDFQALCKEAYPNDEISPATQEDRDACDRPATKDDIQAVLDDLEDIDFRNLKTVLKNAIGGLTF
jgi:hypothetical protein